MAKIIVTGGAGFIGSNLVAELNARGEKDILIVDHLGTAEKWKNLRGLQFEGFQEKKEFRENFLNDLVEPAETVFHLGACSATTETDADYLMDNNYRYTRDLCEWSLSNESRFIYASSAATYGNGEQGYSDDDAVTPKLTPMNMYGFSKHLFDLWAMEHELFNEIVGLKYFNVYGPNEYHKGDMRSVVHKAFCQIRDTGSVSLFKSYRPDYADGEQVRDFIYVKDAVAVTLFFMENPETEGLFNCGTGKARSWNDLAKSVFAAMNKKPNIKYIEMPEHLKGQYQYHTEAVMHKLKAAGYSKPFHTLEDGVRDYVQNQLT
ncbi:MAG: ADP-glyceromanno-heptose 6-epimerase [Kiritimatiellia bacterium]